MCETKLGHRDGTLIAFGDSAMRAILFSAAFVFFCSAAATARGDGMLYQLPEDGAWSCST